MTEGRSLAHVRADARTFQVSLDETSALILSNFITYGVSERTRALGSGERRALVRDAMQTMGRSDILMYRIRFPRDLNAEREGLKSSEVSLAEHHRIRFNGRQYGYWGMWMKRKDDTSVRRGRRDRIYSIHLELILAELRKKRFNKPSLWIKETWSSVLAGLPLATTKKSPYSTKSVLVRCKAHIDGSKRCGKSTIFKLLRACIRTKGAIHVETTIATALQVMARRTWKDGAGVFAGAFAKCL